MVNLKWWIGALMIGGCGATALIRHEFVQILAKPLKVGYYNWRSVY